MTAWTGRAPERQASGKTPHRAWYPARLGVVASFWLLATASWAGEPVVPTLDLGSVLVEVQWVADPIELAEIRRRYESPGRGASPGTAYGKRAGDGVRAFSVLGKRDGVWVCLIFAERPRRVDDVRTRMLGHELAHCLLGDYHVFF